MPQFADRREVPGVSGQVSGHLSGPDTFRRDAKVHKHMVSMSYGSPVRTRTAAWTVQCTSAVPKIAKQPAPLSIEAVAALFEIDVKSITHDSDVDLAHREYLGALEEAQTPGVGLQRAMEWGCDNLDSGDARYAFRALARAWSGIEV